MSFNKPDIPNTVLGKTQLILNQFTIEKPSLSLSEIVQGSGLAKTSCFRLLAMLVDLGFLEQTGRRYQLGIYFYGLGVVAQQSSNLTQLTEGLIMPLAQALDETIILATLDGNEILYLDVTESSNPYRFVASVGQRRELFYGATGLALLSCLSVERLEHLSKQVLPKYTNQTLTDKRRWQELIQSIKEQGYVKELGEYVDGIGGIAMLLTTTPIPLVSTVVAPRERIQAKESQIIEGLEALKATLQTRIKSI